MEVPTNRTDSPVRTTVVASPLRARGRLVNELIDYVSQPSLNAYPPAAVYWRAHVTYARRAATALALGDLHPAQRFAEIAAEALASHYRYGGTGDPSEDRPA